MRKRLALAIAVAAGLSLQATRLYTAGDWLRVGGYEGRVETTDWRSLSLRTADGDTVALPLSLPVTKMIKRLAGVEHFDKQKISLI